MADQLVPRRWAAPVHEPGMVPQPPRFIEEQPQESALSSVLNLLRLVQRNWMVVLATTLCALGLLSIYFARYYKRTYRATAVVRYQDKARALAGDLGGSGTDVLGGRMTDPISSQIQLLQSRTVSRKIVEKAGLRVHADQALPEGWYRDVVLKDTNATSHLEIRFAPTTATVRNGRDVVPTPYGAPVTVGNVSLTIVSRPGVDSTALDIVPLEEAIGEILGAVRGRARERTDFIDVTYESQSPTRAMLVANSAAEAFAEMNAESARRASVRRRGFIQDQLQRTELLLSEAQAAHSRFRTREQTFSSREQFKTQQADVTSIELRRRDLQADRDVYQSLLRTLAERNQGGTERLGALIASPGIASNAVVAHLYGQLSQLQASRDSLVSGGAAATNPDVKRLDGLISAAEGNIVAAVRGQLSALDARITALDELQRRSTSQMAALPTTEATEAGLLAQVETFKQQADQLREAMQKAVIDEAAQEGQIDVVDRAPLPTVPVGTGKKPRFVLALILGLGLGTLISYVRENYTAVVRRREDLERLTTAPTLAVVPHLEHGSSKGGSLVRWMSQDSQKNPDAVRREIVMTSDVRSVSAEAFRTLRTNLFFSMSGSGPRQVIVTSAGPSEGKSTVATNLAVAFAQQGQRTLLIDCDLRKPRLHRIFGLSQIPGLSSALVSNVALGELIRSSDIPNLSLVTAGPSAPNPAELLGSAQMRDLLAKLSASFDMIIIDTPPVLVATDAALLGRYANGAIVVARAGKTHMGAYRDAVRQLATVDTHVVGVVLNDPDGVAGKFTAYYGAYTSEYYGKEEARA